MEKDTTRLEKWELIPLTDETVPEALRIADKHLGAGLYTREELERILGLDNYYFYLARDGETVVGIFCCLWGTGEELSREFSWFPYTNGERYGILRSIAVEEEYRGQNLSEMLIDHFSRLLFERDGVKKICVLAWVHTDLIPAAICLARCGYSRKKMVIHPWYEVADLRCDLCRQRRCTCDGVLFEKESEGSGDE